MYLLKIFFILVLSQLHALADLDVTDLSMSCEDKSYCVKYAKQLQKIRGKYRNIGHLERILKIFLVRDSFEKVSYKVYKNKENYKVDIKVIPRSLISAVSFKFSGGDDFEFVQTAANIQVGSFYNKPEIVESKLRVKNFLQEMGYKWNDVIIEERKKSESIELIYHCSLGPALKLKRLNIDTTSDVVRDIIRSKFITDMNSVFNFREIKRKVGEIKEELFENGRYLVQLQTSFSIEGESIFLNLKTLNIKRLIYSFNGKDLRFKKRDFLADIKDFYQKVEKNIDNETLVKILEKKYIELGYLKTAFNIQRLEFVDNLGEKVDKVMVDIVENQRKKVDKIIFSGNLNFSDDEILSLYKDKQSELASLGIYDKNYYNTFLNKLRDFYLSHGFVEASVQGPIENYQTLSSKLEIEFQVKEGLQTYVDSIKFSGLNEEQQDVALGLITSKVNAFFNPLTVDDDLSTVVNYFQDEGYYNAKIVNRESSQIAAYKSDKSTVSLHFYVVLGPKLFLGDVVILGNDKTKKEYILQNVQLKPGEKLSPSKVKRIQSDLSLSGIFSVVNVEPIQVPGSQVSDLLISLTEKDSVTIEVAPGFRTDLGGKISGQVKFGNLYGMNRSVTLKAQVNQRFNFSTLAPERRNDQEFVEYNMQVNFGAPEIYGSKFNFSSSGAITKKRFYSFDADILRASAAINRDWTDYFSMSLRYQVEEIQQFNAVQLDDNGKFQIGSLAPSLTFDFRDNRINPRSGTYFNLTWEFANPALGSQENEAQTINYEKIISRNRFYIPMGNSVLAIYAAMGVQENKSDNSGIPSIKLFRLTGADIVRGYDDQEMNIAENMADISEFDVTDKVYMSLFKIEPRFYMSDNFILGLFVDGGRLFVDSFQPLDVRSSVGISFKYLTPVGSLDFDYGHKISRSQLPDGTQESPGRLHVSIGFF